MRIAFYLASFVVLAGGANLANAAGIKEQTREKAAKKACLTGDFQKGVEILADLYVETNDPTYLYNQGRCLEQSHRCVDSIDRFKEFVRKSPDLSPALKSDVEKHIADCKAQIAEDKAPPPAPLVSSRWVSVFSPI
jgi:hypothetical protein